jgi:hypothetical protein
MWLQRICCALFLIGAPLFAWSQDYTVQTSIESIIDELGDAEENAEASLDLLHEALQEYAQNPLNINTATDDELLALPVLNEFQVYSLREYLKLYGEMTTTYELQYVHGFTPELMQQLLPFVCALPAPKQESLSLKRMLTDGRHELLLREKHILEQQQGYLPASDSLLAARPNARYAGNKAALYGRYRYRYKDKLQWNVVADKDAGEDFFTGSNKAGFDFYSAHLQVSNIGIVQKLVVGDFYAQFGQGLALWQGMGMGKTSDAMTAARRGAGIKAYSGSDENNFFRGVAASVKIKKLTLNGFVSYNLKDADMSDSTGIFSTQYTTGLHNTAKTIHDKNAIAEVATGLNASYNFKKLRWGATAFWHRYNGELVRDPKPYQIFDLNRNSNFNISSDFRWYAGKFHVFGEAGISQNLAGAMLAGVAADIAQPVQLSLIYRNYAKDYQAVYANAFAKGSKTANESGVYFGTNVAPHAKVKVSFYIDVFSFPWLKYRAHAPGKGFDALLQLDYNAGNDCRMYLRAKYDTKEENVPNAAFPLKTTDDIEKTTLRYNIVYQPFDGMTAQSRIEGTLYKAGGGSYESGIMAFQDIMYKFENPQVGFSVRFAIFNTDTYNARFYAYEDDMLYAFSFPAYYGNGSRWYANVHYTLLERIDIYLRLAQTHYFDRAQTGSGLTLIDSPHRTEFKVQVRIKI